MYGLKQILDHAFNEAESAMFC